MELELIEQIIGQMSNLSEKWPSGRLATSSGHGPFVQEVIVVLVDSSKKVTNIVSCRALAGRHEWLNQISS